MALAVMTCFRAASSPGWFDFEPAGSQARVLAKRDRELATDLFISEKTASVHVSNIKSKLGANGRAEIAAIAVRLGLVPETTGGYDLD